MVQHTLQESTRESGTWNLDQDYPELPESSIHGPKEWTYTMRRQMQVQALKDKYIPTNYFFSTIQEAHC